MLSLFLSLFFSLFSIIILMLVRELGINENDGIAQLVALDCLVCEIILFCPHHHHFDYHFIEGKKRLNIKMIC